METASSTAPWSAGALVHKSYERGRHDALLELANKVADRCALAYLDGHVDAAAGISDEESGVLARLVYLEVATALRERARGRSGVRA